MPVNELRFCRVFRFLAEFFHSGNATSLFGLLHAVSDENMKTVFLIQRKEPENRLKPALPYPVQGPGGGTEEMEHGQITVRLQGEVTDHGSHSELIGTSISPMVRITNQRNAAFLEKQDSKEDKILSMKFNIPHSQPSESMINS